MSNIRLYKETIGGHSPSKGAFTRRGGGKMTRTYIVGDDGSGNYAPAQVTDLTDSVSGAFVELMGSTHTNSDGVRLQRTLPLADPLCPWLFVDAIDDFQGIGNPGAPIPADPYSFFEAPPVDYMAFYPGYLITVSFAPRPYAVVPDRDIQPSVIDAYYDFNGNKIETTGYAPEWLRYTSIKRAPMAEYLEAQAGTFRIQIASGLWPNNASAGLGQAKMLFRKEAIIYTWFEVPYDYIDTGTDFLSFLTQGLGSINQLDFNGNQPGTLLLEALAISDPYTPIVPPITYWNGSNAIYAAQKLCDISFVFLEAFNPLGPDADGNPATPPIPFNLNFVTAGHNLLPYAHALGYYYGATLVTNPDKTVNDFLSDRPLFQSYPFQLLFTNPGVTA